MVKLILRILISPLVMYVGILSYTFLLFPIGVGLLMGVYEFLSDAEEPEGFYFAYTSAIAPK